MRPLYLTDRFRDQLVDLSDCIDSVVARSGELSEADMDKLFEKFINILSVNVFTSNDCVYWCRSK